MKMHLLSALEQAGVDTGEVIHEFSGNEALYIKHVLKFPNEKTMSGLMESVQMKDGKKACEAAHSMKGLAGCLGFKRLFSASSDMVLLLRQGKEEEAFAHFQNVYQYYTEMVEVITSSLEFCLRSGRA